MGAAEATAQATIASTQITPVIVAMTTSIANLTTLIANATATSTDIITNGLLTVPLVDSDGLEVSNASLPITDAIDQLLANRQNPEVYPAGKMNMSYNTQILKKNAENIQSLAEYIQADQVQFITEVSNIAAQVSLLATATIAVGAASATASVG